MLGIETVLLLVATSKAALTSVSADCSCRVALLVPCGMPMHVVWCAPYGGLCQHLFNRQPLIASQRFVEHPTIVVGQVVVVTFMG